MRGRSWLACEAIEKAKNIIYSALKKGSCFVANDYHGDSKGFKFFAEADKKIYQMGEKISKNSKVKLKIAVPSSNAEIKLIRNGRVIESWEDKEASFNVNGKGVYRVEAYLNGKAWIFSNHIRVGI
jgi:hypothetical protein